MAKWLQDAINEHHIISIPFDNFTKHEVITRGAFGEVTRAYWKSGEKTVALKSLISNPSSDSESFKEFVDEFKLIRSVDFHDNVIRFFGVSQGENILDITRKISGGGREDPYPGTPEEYKKLYKQAWDNDPANRPSVDQIRYELDKMLVPSKEPVPGQNPPEPPEKIPIPEQKPPQKPEKPEELKYGQKNPQVPPKPIGVDAASSVPVQKRVTFDQKIISERSLQNSLEETRSNYNEPNYAHSQPVNNYHQDTNTSANLRGSTTSDLSNHNEYVDSNANVLQGSSQSNTQSHTQQYMEAINQNTKIDHPIAPTIPPNKPKKKSKSLFSNSTPIYNVQTNQHPVSHSDSQQRSVQPAQSTPMGPIGQHSNRENFTLDRNYTWASSNSTLTPNESKFYFNQNVRGSNTENKSSPDNFVRSHPSDQQFSGNVNNTTPNIQVLNSQPHTFLSSQYQTQQNIPNPMTDVNNQQPPNFADSQFHHGHTEFSASVQYHNQSIERTTIGINNQPPPNFTNPHFNNDIPYSRTEFSMPVQRQNQHEINSSFVAPQFVNGNHNLNQQFQHSLPILHQAQQNVNYNAHLGGTGFNNPQPINNNVNQSFDSVSHPQPTQFQTQHQDVQNSNLYNQQYYASFDQNGQQVNFANAHHQEFPMQNQNYQAQSYIMPPNHTGQFNNNYAESNLNYDSQQPYTHMPVSQNPNIPNEHRGFDNNLAREVTNSPQSQIYVSIYEDPQTDVYCKEILERFTKEYQNIYGYEDPEKCNAGYHCIFGDEKGLIYHLNIDGNVDGAYKVIDMNEPLVLIAAKNCGGKKMINVFQRLKERNADFSVTSKLGKTAFHLLLENKKLRKNIIEKSATEKFQNNIKKIIEFLAENNCDINAKDNSNRTILSYCLTESYHHQEHIPFISSLLKNNANPNIPVYLPGKVHAPNALFLAIRYRWPVEVLKLLSIYGADKEKEDDDGNDLLLLTVAPEKGKKQIESMIWVLENSRRATQDKNIKEARKHTELMSKEWKILVGFGKKTKST
ncbi:7321_t:CDS:2 [Acaulospora morrowiae]|uniref:7321_t:CDS:1 n=1 Tax=Acaulospora morrowiae TaxID=94023 RepID=A0A9N8VH85_9GLOM|nr:7321_t:CDS:2 [Acaulospora morrowiae]